MHTNALQAAAGGVEMDNTNTIQAEKSSKPVNDMKDSVTTPEVTESVGISLAASHANVDAVDAVVHTKVDNTKLAQQSGVDNQQMIVPTDEAQLHQVSAA